MAEVICIKRHVMQPLLGTLCTDPAKVAALMESIKEIGLQEPVSP